MPALSSSLADEFRYAIVSSGVLGRDFIDVDGGGGGGGGGAGTRWTRIRVLLRRAARDLWDATERLRRGDLALAAAVGVLGMVVLVGWRRVALFAIGILACAMYRAQVGGTRRRSADQSRALDSVHALLSTSSTLDHHLAGALRRLDEGHDEALSSTLHRLCEDLVDHLATASSHLSDLVNRGELQVLAEMHDVPLRREPVAVAMTPSASMPDRFTPVPLRTARVKRASWDPRANLSLSLSLDAPPTVPNPKRRSLQNMHYNPPDLQSLQSIRSETTSASRRLSTTSTASLMSTQSLRSSLLSPPRSARSAVFVSPGAPRVSRVASLSPLTAPALQAACVGVHLKRRRVACELLALKWDGPEAYWDEVCGVIDMLAGRMSAAIEMLGSGATAREERSGPAEPPWTLPSSARVGVQDGFAPRSSDAERLAERIASVQVQLEVAWRECEAAQGALASADGAAVERAWSGLKGAVGNMVRDVERGREVVRGMGMQPQTQTQALSNDDAAASALGPAIDIPLGVPDFVREWTPPSPSLTPHTPPSPTPSSPALAPGDGDALSLPAVGRDKVYEALISDPRRDERAALGRLSREERIAMARRARERGTTVGEMMRAAEGEGEAVGVEAAREREREKEKRRAQSGVVLELEGLMGMIRARKGGGVESEMETETEQVAEASAEVGKGASAAASSMAAVAAQGEGVDSPRTPSPPALCADVGEEA